MNTVLAPLCDYSLGPGTCPLTVESVIAWVIAENVETLVKVRRCALSKVQQYHLKLMYRLQVVAALESRLNRQEDPAEIRCLKEELATLKVKRDKAQHCWETQQQIIDCCKRDLVYMGELECPTTPEGTPSDAPTSTATEEIAEASVEASG